ncbi:hypothetical protein M116_4595 [Bacteroides fragilis str. 3719 A10]|nr:hypothetical protein M116_1863 [Bacteroides fragilis str. 3719 A10]EXZ60559.1 hypothetical protein M116_4595 [Bacteroides fragilis str. 3719 A10]
MERNISITRDTSFHLLSFYQWTFIYYISSNDKQTVFI